MSSETSNASSVPTPEELDELRSALSTSSAIASDPAQQQVFCLTTFFRAQPYPTPWKRALSVPAILERLVGERLISEAVAQVVLEQQNAIVARLQDEEGRPELAQVVQEQQNATRLQDEEGGPQHKSTSRNNSIRSTMPTTATAASVPAAAVTVNETRKAPPDSSSSSNDSKPTAAASELPAKTMTNSTTAQNLKDGERKKSSVATVAAVPIVNRDEISVGFSSSEMDTSFTQKQSDDSVRPSASRRMPAPSASAIDPDSIDLLLEATPLSREEESKSMSPAELAAVNMLLGEPVVLAAGTTTSTTPAKRGPRQTAGPGEQPVKKRGPGRPCKDASPPTTTINGTANEQAAPAKKRGPGRPRKNPLPGAGTTEQGKKKRGPGRPRKNETTGASAAAVATNEKKRGPGRPRKDASLPPPPPTSTNGTVNEQEVPIKKRGPGRPRKNPLPGEEKPKKKRVPGRPRKNETTVPPETSAEAAAAAVVTLGKPIEVAAAAVVADSAAVPQEHTLAALLNSSEKASSSTTMTTTAGTLQKRGRGRPRKHPLPEEGASQSEPKKRGRPRKNPLPEEGSSPQPPKKRGRPRKHPLPEEGAAPPLPKKRGRPRKHPLPEEAALVALGGDATTMQTSVAAAAAPQDANPSQLPPLEQDAKQAAAPKETRVEVSNVAAAANGNHHTGGSKTNSKPERKYALPSYCVVSPKGQVLNTVAKMRLDRPPVPKDSTCPRPPPSDV